MNGTILSFDPQPQIKPSPPTQPILTAPLLTSVSNHRPAPLLTPFGEPPPQPLLSENNNNNRPLVEFNAPDDSEASEKNLIPFLCRPSPNSTPRHEDLNSVMKLFATGSSEHGSILKYSEIFAPPARKVTILPSKKPKVDVNLDNPEIMDELVESDDEEEVHEVDTSINASQQAASESTTSHEDIKVGFSLRPSSETHPQPVECSFNPVEYEDWEDKVLVSPARTDSTKKQPSKALQSSKHLEHWEKSFKPIGKLKKRVHWGELREENAKPMEVSTSSNLPSFTIEPQVPNHLNLNSSVTLMSSTTYGHHAPQEEKQESTEDLNMDLRKFPFAYNQQLDEGKWLENVVWDASSVKKSQVSSSLVLDLNDPYIFPKNLSTHDIESPDSIIEKIASVPSTVHHHANSEETSDEDSEEIEKFNLSSDKFYRGENAANLMKQKLGTTIVHHSEPALKLTLAKTYMAAHEYPYFHRPVTKLRPGERVYVYPTPPDTDDWDGQGTMKRKKDIHAQDGRIVLAEYIEEHPLLLSNPGMGTKITNYYRKIANENPLLRYEDGETVMLEADDKDTPFLGEIKPGQALQSLNNNLFRAPLFKHAVPETDFILVRKGNRAYIREVPVIYTVGQEAPKMEVPTPNSRSATNFLKNRVQAYIYRLFSKNKGLNLKIADLNAHFPDSSEAFIRNRLKSCATFQRGGDNSGSWTVTDQSNLPNEDELRAMVTPEQVCCYESMLEGFHRLRSHGITQNVGHTTPFMSAVGKYEDDPQPTERMKKVARLLEEEILLAPWSLTSNFIAAARGKSRIQVSGIGDPTNRFEGFSYVKPLKSLTVKERKHKSLPKTSVTGTDADLRKLTLDQAKQVLRTLGATDSEFQHLSRWGLIKFIRTKVNEAAANQEENNYNKFVRTARFTMEQQQSEYQARIQAVFENHINALQQTSYEYSDEEDDDFLQMVESKVDAADKKRKRNMGREDEEEKQDFESFLQDFHGNEQSVPSKKEKTSVLPSSYVENSASSGSHVMKLKSKHSTFGLTPEEQQERAQFVREKRRILEQRRRQKQKEKADGVPETRTQAPKCSACGAMGHMKTNRSCPKYASTFKSEEVSTQPSFASPWNADKAQKDVKIKVVKVETPLGLSTPKNPEAEVRRDRGDSARSRRTSANAEVEMSNIFEQILKEVRTHDFAFAFNEAVNEKVAPNYYQIIEKPMDLPKMLSKARKNHYKSRRELLADLSQIVENCYKYNKDRNPYLLPEADRLKAHLEKSLKIHGRKLEELEKEIQEKKDLKPLTMPKKGLHKVKLSISTDSRGGNSNSVLSPGQSLEDSHKSPAMSPVMSPVPFSPLGGGDSSQGGYPNGPQSPVVSSPTSMSPPQPQRHFGMFGNANTPNTAMMTPIVPIAPGYQISTTPVPLNMTRMEEEEEIDIG